MPHEPVKENYIESTLACSNHCRTFDIEPTLHGGDWSAPAPGRPWQVAWLPPAMPWETVAGRGLARPSSRVLRLLNGQGRAALNPSEGPLAEWPGEGGPLPQRRAPLTTNCSGKGELRFVDRYDRGGDLWGKRSSSGWISPDPSILVINSHVESPWWPDFERHQ
jgi:hypothetical protein